MMMQKELVPKRRFERFNNEWKKRDFDEEIELYSGLTYSPSDVKQNGTFVLRSSNVQHGEIVNADNVYVNSEVVNSSNVRKGDIIIVVRNGSRSLIGKHAQIKMIMDKTVIGAFMTGIRSNQSNFINALLDTKKFKDEIDKNLGATINQITNGMFRSMSFFFPNIKEQQKIGQFFQHLDEMITIEQRKIDKTKALKSAYLAEMFPAEGERVPKRRFAGFTDDWQPLRLIEFVDKAVDNRGKTPPLNINGSHPLIEVASIGNGPPDYSKVEKYLDHSSFQNNLRDYIKKNDILFSTVGRIGLVSLMDEHENAAIAQNIVAFRAKESYVPEYIYALFSTEQSKLKANRIVMGAVQPSIKVSQLIHNEYYLTNIKREQKQIGDFFKKLDDSIKNHQQKLEKLKATKQAYLHEMFV